MLAVFKYEMEWEVRDWTQEVFRCIVYTVLATIETRGLTAKIE